MASSSISSHGRTAVYDKTLTNKSTSSSGRVTSTTYANTPFSLRSPSCHVPACNDKEVSARSAFGSDMRSGVTAIGVQHGMSRKRLPHQHDLPPAVKYQDPEKRKRDRRQARRDDGRATDAKQTQKHRRITAICVGSVSPSPTHGDQRGGSTVQANHPFAGASAARSGTIVKNLCLPDTKILPRMPKDTFPANVSTSVEAYEGHDVNDAVEAYKRHEHFTRRVRGRSGQDQRCAGLVCGLPQIRF